MNEKKVEKQPGFRPVIATVKFPVIIQTTYNQIHGNLHARENERIKDVLNANEIFIAITNVQIFNADGTSEQRKSEFLAINRTHVVWIIERKHATGLLNR